VFLQQWNGRSWLTAARSTSPGADEQLSFTGPAGFYRVRVQSNRGSGAYTVGIRVE
jgi:streptogrisin C